MAPALGAPLTALLLALFVKPGASVTPVQKVVELLNGMVEKGKKEKHDEQVQFAAYKQFCDDTSVEKQRSIAEGNEMIEKLTADIEKYEDDAARLEKEIAKHEDDIATWEGDRKASTKVREIEKTDYTATHKDYSESIAALKAGVKTLQGQNKVTKQASAALAQVSAHPLVSPEEKRALSSFLQRGEQDLDETLAVDEDAPAAAAYEFQSKGLIDMLEKLVEKFEDEQTELEKEEKAAVQEYELLIQDLKSYTETGTSGRNEKAEAKAKALAAAAEAKGDLADATATRDDDTKYLADLQAACEQKAAAFEERQKLRGEEIEAIEKAIEILASGAVAGNAEKHLPGLLQLTGRSWAQLRAKTENPAQLQVAAYLSDRGDRLNSRILKVLAMRVTEDPFKKVTKMIKDLIVKLMEEANGEAEHKGWCDDELSANEQTRKEKTEAVEMLHSEIDELEASVSQLTEEIADLTKSIGEMDAAVTKATEVRQTEKTKNAATIKDAKEAQAAVASALAVLKEFYAKAGEATALVQQPEVFDEPYKGMGGESGGVVGMIEVIQSDFARLETETAAAEAEGQKEFDEFTTDSATDKAQKQKDVDDKAYKKQGDELALQEKKGDLDGTQKELTAGIEYYDKLKPSCISTGVSYEDSVARRKEEIASLREALSILEGEAVR